MMDVTQARELFKSPPMAYRPTPFWFWNDRLDTGRLLWQFDQLVDAGAGGAVLHARSGLDPEEYLDDRWFAAIGAVIERAAQRNAIVWLYDELGWPSGTAGGRIPREHPDLAMVHLRLEDIIVAADGRAERRLGEGEEKAAGPGSADVVAAFQVVRSDPLHGYQRRHDGSGLLVPDRIVYEPIPLPVDPSAWKGERLLVFRKVPVAGALNYFDRRATEEFLHSTHEQYFRRFSGYFGTTIKCSFMDEAGMFAGVAELPWDRHFEEVFRARRGYCLLPHLPALFFETSGYETIRFDFWSLVAELFREGFAVPMNEWCTAHGIAYSGHYLMEATLKEALRQVGATMPLYEHQGLPGIDILGNDFYSRRFEQEAYGYYVVTIKQAASVCRQLGKPGLMSESYGVGGHAMGPEAMQSATNFQMALGVTQLVHHAAFYSTRGDRKLDCPPAIDWREPYWPFVRNHFDNAARTGWLLSQGKALCEVLVLHPASSIQATYRQFRTRDEYKAENYLMDADLPFEVIDKQFTLLSVALLDAQIDHDYGDEEIMAVHGHVADGRLHVGQASYGFVVLPPVLNMRSSTLALLQTFAAQGGTILAVGTLPRLVDGKPSQEARTFLEHSVTRVGDGVEFFDYSAAVSKLTSAGARTVLAKTSKGEDVPSLKVQRRAWEGRELWYIANVSTAPASAIVAFLVGVTGRLEEWDPTTGETRPMMPCNAGEALHVQLDWAPKQARLIVAIPNERDVPMAVRFSTRRALQPTWTGTCMAPNVLVLDECTLKAPGAPRKRMAVHEAQTFLRRRISEHSGPVHLITEYSFTVSRNDPPASVFELALEPAANAEVRLNREKISLEPTGWFLDPAVARFPLPHFRPGKNVLAVQAAYEDATQLQSPWLLGDFMLASKDCAGFLLKPGRSTIPLGPWPEIGLPFYAGTVVYAAEVDLEALPEAHRVVLDMPGLAGSAGVRVNGCPRESGDAKHVLWPPYECDLTGLVRPGVNRIEIEVANTLRNLLGPHYEPREDFMTGFSQKSHRGKPGEPKRFRAYGLLAPPTVVVHT